MTDFVNAFRIGQAAAEESRAARKSISELIDRVSNELSNATGGRIELKVEHFNVFKDTLGPIIGALATPPKYVKETYLAATNPLNTDGKWVKLIAWDQPREGFPCRLEFGSKQLNCYDIESLEAAISDALSTSAIGEKLAALIASAPDEPS
ncbi:hypothetical protein [Luteibacter sp. 22Crub2.1]|uniref:hypothetical protein n=1 Tax=Luteibacter sp. 22Crub2.1 TaxID=1283288 RepID=UPI0009A6F68A|nr:hypothetical protein [Luteibacter sp. 22Crub2.1]SKB69369.1 hypothetical protein SAMN05660880_02189 [Luteibacter sp. 22Crub2.1]